VDHNARPPADALTALNDIQELLSAHPDFKVVPVSLPAGPPRRPSRLGLAIRSWRFRKFGAEFEGGLTLLHFRLHSDKPGALILDLQWHAIENCDGLAVFIHFVDAANQIRFQGDYPLETGAQDALGFFFSRRRVQVPEAAPTGMYRVRVGVWRPADNRHMGLGRFSGCRQESPGWCQNAVIVDSLHVDAQRPTGE
jgi:hypothetical protein